MIKKILSPVFTEIKDNLSELLVLLAMIGVFLGLPHLYQLVNPEARVLDLVYLQLLAYGAAKFLVAILLAWLAVSATLPTLAGDMESVRVGWKNMTEERKYVWFTVIFLALTTLAVVCLSWIPVGG